MGDNNNRNHVVGVDLGGTKILAGVFDTKLQPLGATKLSTKAQRGPEAVIERVARCVLDAIDECDLSAKQIRAVGIGAPGAVDPEQGEVLFAPNLEWKNVPIVKELEKRLDVPVFLENDCSACMLGVYEEELKSKPKHVLGIFVGTGIGGG
jgi:glucokinase